MSRPHLTTSVGTPVDVDDFSVTAGERGPVLLQDFNLIDKLSHFDRERIPERVVHAKGAGAHGYFEVTHDVTQFCKAKFLDRLGKRTPVFTRFSTVGGELGSADSARDPRGYAIKFYTEEGNWDMVGNNTPVFFVRDPTKFPDFIHTQKRNPQTHLKDPDAFWDFLSLVPESLHQVTILFSNRGTPRGYRHMDGFSSHTLRMVNQQGVAHWVKFHFKTNQGIKNYTADESVKMAGENADSSIQDLFESIQKGDFPSWNVFIQVMKDDDVWSYKWDSFDVTKVWPHSDFPLLPVGRLVLNRNPDNYFAEVEQSAFSPAHMVPGIEASLDKMLQARLFSYPDTHRHRLGVNYNQIPINAPLVRPINYQRDGLMAINGNGGSGPNYFPNSTQGTPAPSSHQPAQAEAKRVSVMKPYPVSGLATRHFIPLTDADFVQPGNLYRLMSRDDQQQLVNNIVGHLKHAKRDIIQRQLAHFKRADAEYGRRIEQGILEASSRM